MAKKHHKPEEIVAKLRQVEVLLGQGKAVAEAVRAIAVMEATYYRWRAEYVGLKLDQVKRLKQLEQENNRLGPPVAAEPKVRFSCRENVGSIEISLGKPARLAFHPCWNLQLTSGRQLMYGHQLV